MGKVLLTGATGFIGGHLIDALLRRGDEVRCLVRRSSQLSGLDSSQVEFVRGDVLDRESVSAAVKGVDEVYHVAGLTRAFRRTEFWDVNEQGTANLAEACARQPNPPVHVYISSIAASGPTGRGQRRTEEHAPAPVSNYGKSKLAGEEAAKRQARNVPTSIVRPGIVFGPRNRECFPIFQTIQRLGIHPVPGFRAPPLSYIHVDDLVQLLLEVGRRGSRVSGQEADERCRGYYFATVDEHPSYSEFGRMVGRAMGRPRPIVIPIAMPALYVCASVNELISRCRRKTDPFNIDKMREANVFSWACSPERARRELGFQPRATLEEHLAATVEWYRAHGWLPEDPAGRVSSAMTRETSTPMMASTGPAVGQR